MSPDELLILATDHDKAAKIGLAVGPNVNYVRTFQLCAAALRVAARHMDEFEQELPDGATKTPDIPSSV